MFLKRQKEVSETFARVICTEVVHVRAIFEEMYKGPLSGELFSCSASMYSILLLRRMLTISPFSKSGNFYAMLRAHTLVFTDKMTAELTPIAVAAMGAERFAEMKESIAQKVLDAFPHIIDQSYEYTQKALGIEQEMSTKMKELSSAEFEGVLHPAFEEDEIQLIILVCKRWRAPIWVLFFLNFLCSMLNLVITKGGVLGALVGAIQIVTIFRI